MKRFLIGFFAVIGVITISIMLLSFVLGVVGSNKKQDLPDRMVLTMNLDDGLEDGPPKHSFLATLSGAPKLTLHEIIQSLDVARQDNRVQGLALRLRSGQLGLASIQELRNAVMRFRRSGKFAYVYADTLGDRPATSEYWLATSFDQIWLQPLGELALTHFATELPFARGLLDKVGVEAEMLHAGKYKSYPETVMRTSASPENRAMMTSLLHDLDEQFVADVTATRHVSGTDLQQTISHAPIAAEEALLNGTIDSIGYYDEFDAYVEQASKGADSVDFGDYATSGLRAVPGEKMGLVQITGALTNVTPEEAMQGDVVSAEEISSAIHDAADTHDVRAIVVRVNSPGGTPLAAEIIRRAITLARVQKPVVISMGDTAASGGYWLATTANALVAQPATLTGSIGVFGGKFNVKKLWDKLNVNWEAVPADASTDQWTINRPYSNESRARTEALLERTYQQFITRVAKGRKLSPEKVEEIAQGRVWTGAQALQNRLVDRLGGLDTAVTMAKELVKLSPRQTVTLVRYPRPNGTFEDLINFLRHGLPGNFLGTWMQSTLQSMMKVQMQTRVVSPVSGSDIR